MENTTLEQPIIVVTEKKEEIPQAPSVTDVADNAGKVILILGIVKLVGDFVVIILKFFQL